MKLGIAMSAVKGVGDAGAREEIGSLQRLFEYAGDGTVFWTLFLGPAICRKVDPPLPIKALRHCRLVDKNGENQRSERRSGPDDINNTRE